MYPKISFIAILFIFLLSLNSIADARELALSDFKLGSSKEDVENMLQRQLSRAVRQGDDDAYGYKFSFLLYPTLENPNGFISTQSTIYINQSIPHITYDKLLQSTKHSQIFYLDRPIDIALYFLDGKLVRVCKFFFQADNKLLVHNLQQRFGGIVDQNRRNGIREDSNENPFIGPYSIYLGASSEVDAAAILTTTSKVDYYIKNYDQLLLDAIEAAKADIVIIREQQHQRNQNQQQERLNRESQRLDRGL